MVANYLPHSLVILNAADLTLERIIPIENEHGEKLAGERSVRCPTEGKLHRRSQGSEGAMGNLVRRTIRCSTASCTTTATKACLGRRNDFRFAACALDDYLDDFFFDPGYEHVIGAARSAGNGQVVDLDIGRKIAEIDLPGMPHLGSGITWDYRDSPVVVTPNLRDAVVSVIDMNTWRTVERIETLGPGFFMRSHENSRFAWVDVFFGPNRDAVHVIDKQTLEIVKTLRPAPGKTAAHVEFTRDGRYALLSIWDMDGAVIVYDSESLEEVKRLPMKKPSGKYNVYNKITRSRGTSH